MNKLLTKIVGVALGATMAVGVGVGVAVNNNRGTIDSQVNADDTIAYTITYTVGGNDSGSTAASISSGGDYASISSSNYAYARTKGMWLSSNNYAGNATLSLTDSGKIKATKIVTSALTDNNGSLKITVTYSDNTTATQTYSDLTTSAANKEITLNSSKELKTIYYETTAKKAKVSIGSTTVYRDNTPSADPSVTVPSSLTLTAGGSSSTAQATVENINNPTYSWSRTDGDDCVTLTNTTSATVTVAPKGSTFASCTLSVTVNGTNGGNPITPITKTVSVSVNKVPTESNPYTVAEARYAIDNDKTKTNVFVTGIVSQVDSISSGAITYWISDDGTTTNQFEVYKGKDASGANFNDISDVLVGDIVVVSGTITLYNSSVYEFTSGSQRVSYSRVTISSIAIKTAPNKTAYISGEAFAPAGLVITVTYSDSNTEDVAYSGNENKFSFSPSTITSAGNVTITYGGQTCTQAVTLLTVKRVTGVASAPTEVYKDGSIAGSEVTLNVLYSDDTTVGTVQADHVNVTTSSIAASVEATAWYTVAETDDNMKATFNVEVKKMPSWDYLADTLTKADFSATNATYTDTTNIRETSDARYYANTNVPNVSDDSTGKRFSLRTNNNNSGIVSTTSGGFAYKVEVNEVYYSAATTRTLDVYGSNTAYTSPSDLFDANKQGTKLASLSSSSKEYTFTNDYAYIGLRSSDGAIMITTLTITWRIEGAENPLTANPVLSTGNSASVDVGKNLALSVTTTPSDSDEKLIATSSDESYVSVSGSGRNFVIHGVAIGSATITVSGAKGTYKSSVVVTVTAASKTYGDKILTVSTLGISSYDTSVTAHSYDGVNFNCYNVMNSNGMQFKAGEGYITNAETMYGGASANIKSITLMINSNNKGTAGVYEGTSTNPSTTVSASVTTGKVVTYNFSSNMTYFKISSTSGTLNIDKIIIELVDGANSVLGEARSAASVILNKLNGLCGGNAATGVVTQAKWDELSSALAALNLSNDAKLFLKDAERLCFENLSQGGATIENAMAHYDACVSKFGYTDVLGISNVASANPSLNNGVINNTAVVTTVVIVSVIGLSTLCGYFLLRKRKEEK